MLALRWLPRSLLPWKRKRRYGAEHVITMNADGSKVRVAVSAERWAQGGHHPNWWPDGEHVLMNLNTQGDGLRFARLALDSLTCETLVPGLHDFGHPTLHPDAGAAPAHRTPTWTNRSAFGDGTAPIRLDRPGQRRPDAVAPYRHPAPGGTLDRCVPRRSPSRAWDRSHTRIAFNACPDGKRRVFVADLHDILRDR